MAYFLKKLLFSCQHSSPIDDDWKGEVHLVKVISVYDGDTLTVALIRNGKYIKQKVRMNGYDTPEIKPSLSKPNREKEIEMAKKARSDFISQHQEYMWLFCDGRDKYGRILGRLYRSTCMGGMENISINDWMIRNSHAYPYDGGTKKEWVEIQL